MLTQHRDEIESQAGKKFDLFEPHSQRTQVVAGTNYFFKVNLTGATNVTGFCDTDRQLSFVVLS